jgi:hypothetical protein
MTRFDEERIDGFDYDWFVIDNNNEIAVCITAGLGQMPESVLCSVENNQKLNDFFASQPIISNSVLDDYEIKRADDLSSAQKMFAESCLKGLYVYDAAIKRGGRGVKYFKIFAPVKPLKLEQLPQDIQTILTLTMLREHTFRDSDELLINEIL